MAKQLDGMETATGIRAEVRTQGAAYRAQGMVPTLAVVSVGDNGAARAYVASLGRAAAKLEVAFVDAQVQASQEAVNKRVATLAVDPEIHGIILALPFAKGIDVGQVYAQLPPAKDIDGLGPDHFGALAAGHEDNVLLPATPQACLALAQRAMDVKGANAVILGRGKTVGRGLAAMLLNRHATVTVCHSATKALAEVTRRADVIFCAAGHPGLVTADYVQAGQVVIDAGVSVVDGKLRGDVDFAVVEPIVAAITPSPGGVGPVTMAFVFANLMRAIHYSQGNVS